MKPIKLLAAVVLIFGLVYALSVVWALGQYLVHDYHLYKAESLCVAEMIAEGVERKEIITKDGSCWVKE